MAESPLSPLLIDLAPAGENSSVTVNEPALIPANQLANVDLPNNTTSQLPVKLPDMNTSNSESENDETIQTSSSQATAPGNATTNTEGERAASPPPNCAICLGRCRKKCFTDSCMHQFCFKCLCEWSKVKPECPLCKQTFKSIIHNVKSMHQFEEYHVQPPTVQIHHSETPANIQYGDVQFRLLEAEPGSSVPGRPRIIFPTFIGSLADPNLHRSNVPVHPYLANLRGHSGHSADNLHMDTFSWRCVIYSAKLYALPVCDIGGRYRESSARFYRDNPAQMHRLIPFINRDVSVLLRNSSTSVNRVVESINLSLPLMNISSPAFRRRLHPFLGESTSHFIHELTNFARSPYDMIGYDRVVHYMPRNYHRSQAVEFSSTSSVSSGEDNRAGQQATAETAENSVPTTETSQVENNSSSRPAADYAAFSVSNTAEGAEVSGISMVSQSTAINLSTHNRAADTPPAQIAESVEVIELDDEPEQTVDPTVHEVPDDEPITHAEPTITGNIDLAASSSSDCEFVLARKPPHLRTPELVSLNSESDSDVVFVAEEKPQVPAVTTEQKTPSTSVPNAVRPTTRTRQSGYDGLFMGASTSTAVTTAQRKRVTRRSARKRSNALSKSTTNEQGKNKRKYKASRPSVGDSSTSTSDSDKDSTVAKSKKRNIKPNNNNKPTKTKSVQTTNIQTNDNTTRRRLKRRQTRSDRDSSTTLKKKPKPKEVNNTQSSDEEFANLKELKTKLELLKQSQELEKTKTTTEEQENAIMQENVTEHPKNALEHENSTLPLIKNEIEAEETQTEEAEEDIDVDVDVDVDVKIEADGIEEDGENMSTKENSENEDKEDESDSSNSTSSMTGSTPVLSRTPSGKGYSSSSTYSDSTSSIRSGDSLKWKKRYDKDTTKSESSPSSSSSSSVSSLDRIQHNWDPILERAERELEAAIAIQIETEELEREISANENIVIPQSVIVERIRPDGAARYNRGSCDDNTGEIDIESDETFILNGYEEYDSYARPNGE